MLTWKLAWRSFLRNRWRSILSCLAIALGLSIILGFDGLTTWGNARRVERGVRMGSGHVVVQPEAFQPRKTLDHLIERSDELAAVARGLPGVIGVTTRLHGHGLLSAGEHSAAALVVGVEPDREAEMSTISSDKKRIAGHYLRPRAELDHDSALGDIYVGDILAKSLDLELDDRVVLTVTERESNEVGSAAFLVRGIFKTRVRAIDGFRVEITLPEAQKLFQANGVTQVAALVSHPTEVAPVMSALEQLKQRENASWQILSWDEALPLLGQSTTFERAVLGLLMAIIFVVAAIGMLNTLLMSIFERTQQFGVMMAIGTSRRRMFATIVVEALILGLAGVVVGTLLGGLIHAYLVNIGVDASIFYGKDVEVAGMIPEGRVSSVLLVSHVARWVAAVMVTVVIAALYPAYRVTRLRPVEAINHV